MPDKNPIADWNYNVQNGVEDKQAEQVAPPAIPGNTIPAPFSGGGNKPVVSEEDKQLQQSMSYVDKVATSKTPQTSFPTRDFIGDTTRYPSMYPGQSNQSLEEQFGKNQGAWTKLAYGTAKGVGSLAKGAADMAGLVADTGYMLGGGSFVDNPYNKWANKLKSDWDQNFPLYETQSQKNSWTPTTNSLPKALDMLGMFAGMALGSKGLGVLGKVSQLGKLVDAGAGIIDANYMAKVKGLSEVSERMAAIEASGKPFTADIYKALDGVAANRLAEGLSDVQKAIGESKSAIDLQYAGQMKTYTTAMQGASHMVMNLGIASAMGYEGEKNFRDQMMSKVKSEGREPTQEELSKIDEYAKSIGTTTTALTGLMGAITLSGFFKSIVGKSLLKTGAQEELGDIIAKNVEGKAGGLTEEGFAKTSADKVSYSTPTFTPTATSAAGKLGQRTLYTAKWLGKKINDNFDISAGIAMSEFGIAGSSVDNYYEKKFDKGDANLWQDALLPNLKNLATSEGIGSILMGAISAVPFEIGRKWSERAKVDGNTRDAINALNTTHAGSYLEDLNNSVNRGSQLNKEQLDATQAGDDLTKNNKREESWQNYLYPRIKFGLKSVIDNDIAGYRKLAASDEGIQELRNQNLVPADGDIGKIRSDFNEHLDDLQKKADRAENYYKALNTRLGADPRYSKEHIEKLLYLSGMTDDSTDRILKLHQELQGSAIKDTRSEPDKKGAVELLGKLNAIVSQVHDASTHRWVKTYTEEISKQVDKLPINDIQKGDIYQKLHDMVALGIAKNDYLRQYHDIVYNPAAHKDFVKSSLITNDDELKGTIIKGVKTKNAQPMDLKVGEEYYAGERVVPGKSPDGTVTKFKKFSRFTVVGEGVDESGNRTITVRNAQGQEQTIQESVFSNYKIGSVKGVEKNRNAKYYLNNINSVYEYKIGKDRVKGRLNYDPEQDEFSFVYLDPKTLKRESTVITKDQFRDKITKDKTGGTVAYEARIKKVGEVTEADKEFLQAKDTEREQLKRDMKLETKREILAELITKKQAELNKTTKQIQEHKQAIKELREKVRELRSDATSDRAKSLYIVRGVNDTQKLIKETKESLDKAIDSKAILENELEDLNDLLGVQEEGTTLSHAFMKEMSDIRDEFQNIINETDKQIDEHNNYLLQARKMIRSLLEGAKKVARKLMADKELPLEDINELEKFIDKEYPDQDISGYSEQQPDYSEGINHIKRLLDERKDIKVRLVEASDDITKNIDRLEEYRDKVQKQLDVVNNVIDAFNDHLDKLQRDVERQQLLNSEPMRQKLRALQGQLDKSYVIEEGEPDDKVTYGPATKAVNNVWYTGILPSHGEHSTDHDNWSDRYNAFTVNSNLDFPVPVEKEEGSSYIGQDPDYSSKMRVIVVTHQNQHRYFPEEANFIGEKYTNGTESNLPDNSSKASISFIHVYKDTDGFKFIDKNGKILNTVGAKDADPNKVVFIRMETAEESRSTGYEKYHVPAGMKPEEAARYVEQAKAERARIVANTEPSRFYNYRESLGVPNYAHKSDGTRVPIENSVSDAKLLPADKIGTGVIKVLSIPGAKIEADGNLASAPLGRPMLQYKSNVAYLNSKRIFKPVEEGGTGSEKEVDHLYKVIKAMADSRVQDNGSIHHVYTDYLKAVLNFSSKVKEETGISNNQLFIDKDGLLSFKIDGKIQAVPFTPQDISDSEVLIKNWLKRAFHSVDSKKLSEGGKWAEVTKINYDTKGQLLPPDTRIWSSYEHYLLSDTDPEGNKRDSIPLTTNIKSSTEDWDGPFMNKYIIPQFNNDYFPKLETKKKEEKAPEPKEETATEGNTNNKTVVSKGKTISLDGSTINSTNPLERKENMFGKDIITNYVFKYTANVDKDGNVKIKITGNDIIEKNDDGSDEVTTITDVKDSIRQADIMKIIPTLEKGLTDLYKENKQKPAEPIKEEVKTESIQEQAKPEVANAVADMMARAKGKKNKDFMEIIPGELAPQGTIDKEEFDKYLKTVSPQLSYDILPEVIKTGTGTLAWGSYQDHYIQLYEGAPAGAEYHEHYHAVEDSFLPAKDIKDIRTEFRARKGSYTDRFGKVIDYATATEREVREKLAEEFKDFKKENPKYTSPGKIKTFFKRVSDFIKHVLLGKPTTIQEIFKKINSSYYKDSQFVRKAPSETDYSEMKGLNENEKKYILHGMFERVLTNLRNSNGDLVRLADGMSEEEVFEPVFQALNDYYTNPEADSNIWARANGLIEAVNEGDSTSQQKEYQIQQITNQATGAYELWNKVTSQKKAVIDDLKSFMKKHRLDFTKGKNPRDTDEQAKVDTQAANDVASENTEDNKDRGYDVDTLTIDQARNAALEVKLLFASLVYPNPEVHNPNLNAEFGHNDLQETPSKLSPLLLPELVDSSKYMYQVLDEMEGILDPNTIQEKLFDMAKSDPAIVRLYNTVYKVPKTDNDWRLRVSFYNFAAKIKPDYLYIHMNDDGETSVRSANLDTDARGILSSWESDLRTDTSGVVSINAQGLYQADTKKLKSPAGNGELQKQANTIKFLQQLKFPVDDTVMSRLTPNDRNTLVNESAKLYDLFRQGNQQKTVSAKGLDAQPLGKISKVLAKVNIVPSVTSHTNMDGNRVQNHIMFNTITRMMSKINEAKTLDKLKEIEPRYFNDTWCKNTLLLTKGGPLFDDSGAMRTYKNGEQFKLSMTIIEGLYNEKATYNPRVSTGKMNEAVRFMTTLNMNLGKGGLDTYANFIAAESKTEAGTTIRHYISPTEYRSLAERTKVFGNTIIGYLKDEIDLIKENISGSRKLLSGALDNDNYKKLQVFKDVLPEDLVKEITAHANDPQGITTDKFVAGIKDKVVKAVIAHIDTQVQRDADYLIDRKVITVNSKGTHVWHGVNAEALKGFELKSDKLSKESVDDILRFRGMNLFMHNTEMRKLFFAPWYEVGDAPKRDKLLQSGTTNTYTGDSNFNSWFTGNQRAGDYTLTDKDALFHNYSDTFHQLTFAEVQSYSKNNDHLSDMYKKIDEMDAQGITLDRYWKEYKLRSGDRWTEADEAQHQYDMAAAREAYYKLHPEETYTGKLKKADTDILDKGNPHTEGTGTPLKPMGSGMQVSDTQFMPFADKTSIFRLTYPIAKERGLEDLYWFMQDKNIATVGPKSWQKYGRPSLSDTKEELPQLYKIDGDKVNFGLSDLTDKQLAKVKTEIPWANFNKIVETAKNKDGKTRATQPLSLLTVNGHSSGIPTDFYNEDKDNLQQKQQDWNKLTPVEKRKSSDMYRMWDDHNKAVAARSYKGYEDTLRKLGVTEDGNSYNFNNPQRIIEFLKNEVTRRDLPENVSDGLAWEYDSDQEKDVLKYPLEAMSNYHQLNNILWSIVDKNILSPKMNGTDNILVSSAGFEKRGIREVVNKDGKKFLASSDLAYYKRGENGKPTSEMEVYAPNHLQKVLQAHTGPKLSERELYDYLHTADGQKLLKAIGFRIPTQGINSMDVIKIKPWSDTEFFMPAEMGNSVIVPSEIVTKVGSDFDVDKMGTYHYNFYVDAKGYPRVIDFIEDTQTDEGLEKLYEQKKRVASLDAIDDILNYEWSTTADLNKQITQAQKEIESIDKFIAANKGADPYRINSKQAVENKYFDTMAEILQHPDNYEQLVTPNSSEELIAIKNDITNLLDPESKNRSKKDINYSNLLDPMYLNEERQDYRDATGNSIGIGAQNNTLHAQSQLAYLPIEDNGTITDKAERKLLGDFKIYLPHKKVRFGDQMKTVLSGIRNSAGSRISDFISQIINGSVDAVKDKWLIEMLGNKELLSTATFLGRAAVDPKHVFFFLNQPIVQEFIKQEQIHRDIRILNPTVKFMDPEKLLAKVKAMTYKDGPESSKRRSTDFALEEFRDVLKATGEGKKMNELTAGQRDLQRQVIHEFLKYRTLANHSLQEQLGFLTANMPRVNDASIETKNKRVTKAKNTSSLGLMKALEGKTFHSSILDYLNKAKEAKFQVTPITGHQALDAIVKVFADPEKRIKEDVRADAIGKAVMSFIDFATQTRTQPRELNKYIDKVLVNDKTSAARQLAEVRKSMTGDMKDLFDNILSSIQSNYKVNSRDVKNVSLVRRPVTAIEAGQLTEALRVLRDNPNTNELYRNIVTASFLQSGVGYNKGSIHQYLPNEDVIKFLKPVIDRMWDDQMKEFNTTNAFYRNNYGNTDIVPVARQRTDLANEYKYYDYYQHEGLKKLTDKYPNGPKFLSLHSIYDRARITYPVIQAKEDALKTDGKAYSKAEKEAMVAIGDYSFKKVRLFQQVLDNAGNKVTTGLDKDGNPSYLYKQINAWGDGYNAQEYYDQARPSILDKHEKIAEIPDEEVKNAMGKGNQIVRTEPTSEIKESKDTPTTLKEENNKPDNKPTSC